MKKNISNHERLVQKFHEINWSYRLGLKIPLIQIVESENFWGQWDEEKKILKFTTHLFELDSWYFVEQVLKHEMVHQWISVYAQVQEPPHGPFFVKKAKEIGLQGSFLGSTIDEKKALNQWYESPEYLEEKKKSDKIKKLMELAQSSNPHEAELALKKAHELSQKVIDSQIDYQNSRFQRIQIQLKKKRVNQVETQKAQILIDFFNVDVIFTKDFYPNLNQELQVLTLLGRVDHVLLSEHVYFFLSHRIEEEWKKNKRLGSKIQFQLGVLSGFRETLGKCPEKEDFDLKNYTKTQFPRLRVSQSSGVRLRNREAFQKGKIQGRTLVLKKPLDYSTQGVRKLLK